MDKRIKEIYNIAKVLQVPSLMLKCVEVQLRKNELKAVIDQAKQNKT